MKPTALITAFCVELLVALAARLMAGTDSVYFAAIYLPFNLFLLALAIVMTKRRDMRGHRFADLD